MRVCNHNSLQVKLGQGLEPVSLPSQGSQAEILTPVKLITYSIVLIISRPVMLLIFWCLLFWNSLDVLFITFCSQSIS